MDGGVLTWYNGFGPRDATSSSDVCRVFIPGDEVSNFGTCCVGSLG